MNATPRSAAPLVMFLARLPLAARYLGMSQQERETLLPAVRRGFYGGLDWPVPCGSLSPYAFPASATTIFFVLFPMHADAPIRGSLPCPRYLHWLMFYLCCNAVTTASPHHTHTPNHRLSLSYGTIRWLAYVTHALAKGVRSQRAPGC